MAPNNNREVPCQLPEDVLVDILCLLPAKCLTQCKCVSKAWSRLITYICVPRMRISATLAPIDGFFFGGQKRGNIDYVSFDDPKLEEVSTNPLEMGGTTEEFMGRYSSLPPFNPSPDALLDVCHGLLLFASWCSSSGPQYYVCNPATTQFASINPTTTQCVRIPKGSFSVAGNCYASLAFDPSESPHYKVVRFLSTPGNHCVPTHRMLDVFSSETGTWVRHKIQFQPFDAFDDDDERYMTRHSCYLDGVLYRMSWSHHLVCFNLRTMTRQAIDLPLKYVTDINRFLGVSKGRLHYANNDKDDRYRILVWVLSDTAKSGDHSGDAWTLKYSIICWNLILCFPRGSSKDQYRILDKGSKMFAIHPTSDIVYIGDSRAIFSHHLGTNELHEVCSFVDGQGRVSEKDQKYCFPYSICDVALKEFDETIEVSMQENDFAPEKSLCDII